ncbi:hypothetical protein WOLCODRAFT_75425 [Wolfiporia cocos MD-104 SS10]|uniref:AB hydrolase-1 domain-containing protein n=1 Tax=Wolfiporia cocos (strain MD-104) TaxID=742152 RepID=A0A2H3JP47_WOLCO|nr:hypothetical protein WOLCODRAFT_75425 [Wolfiporia cocos MD-104 SS10]
MPLAPINSKGEHLYFEDTGVPPNAASYTTLVLIHGAAFHGGNAIFHPMYQFENQGNIRFVTLNLRDYPGSTSTPLEVVTAALENKGGFFGTLMQERGLDIAAFIEWLITTEDIPPKSVNYSDGKHVNGGISVLGWSAGSFLPISLLAHGSSLSRERQERLGAYLRSIILLDPPYAVLGIAPPFLPERINPLREQSDSTEQSVENFFPWVSGYYRHSPDILSLLASLTRAELVAGLGQSPVEDIPPTTKRMSPEDLATVTSVAQASRAHIPLILAHPPVYTEVARRALKKVNVWPDVHVTFVWCDMAPGDHIIAAWEVSRKVRMAWPLNARRVDIVRMSGANHFPHWDKPEETMRLLTSIA